jgi:hypothetical protein
MIAIDFSDANLKLVKPDSMTDEECYALSAYRGMDNKGNIFFLTQWMPSKEDLEALHAGRPIYLKILCAGFFPVSLYTVDEEGKPNT